MTVLDPSGIIEDSAEVPGDRTVQTLDVRDLGPPEPLAKTLETLVDVPSDAVLVQFNDRAPQFLYPKLEDRGFEFETVERPDEDVVVTAIWEP